MLDYKFPTQVGALGKEEPTPEESLLMILKELNKHGLDTQKRLVRTVIAFVINQ